MEINDTLLNTSWKPQPSMTPADDEAGWWKNAA